MEMTELSKQLKTVDIVDKHTEIPQTSNEKNHHRYETRRLTRSQCIPSVELNLDNFLQKPARKNLDSEEEIKKFYLNNKVKVVHKHLETILEVPVEKRGSTMYLSMNKQKRSLYLCREFRITTKQKSCLRKKNIKRLGKRGKPLKLTDVEFKAKMLEIDKYLNTSDDEWNCDPENNQTD